MPRLFRQPESIPGLTRPDIVFNDRLEIPLGAGRGDLVLEHCGAGPYQWRYLRVAAGTQDSVYRRPCGSPGPHFIPAMRFIFIGPPPRLDKVKAYGAETLVGGRGSVVHGHDNVDRAIEQSRHFLKTMIDQVSTVFCQQGSIVGGFYCCTSKPGTTVRQLAYF